MNAPRLRLAVVLVACIPTLGAAPPVGSRLSTTNSVTWDAGNNRYTFSVTGIRSVRYRVDVSSTGARVEASIRCRCSCAASFTISIGAP